LILLGFAAFSLWSYVVGDASGRAGHFSRLKLTALKSGPIRPFAIWRL
jgi:hypothetical protein